MASSREDSSVGSGNGEAKHHWLVRYAFALAAVGAGALLRLLVTILIGPGLPIYITFYPAVMLAALMAGVGPGLLATVAAALVADYWLLLPQGLFFNENPVDTMGMVLFIGMGVFMTLVAGRYLQIRDTLEKLVKERTEELQESENRFKAIAESTPVGMGVVAAPMGEFLYVNQAYEKAFGYPKGELLDQRTQDIYFEVADRDRILQLLKEGGSVTDYEVRLRRKDGTPFWSLSSIRPIVFEGKPALLGAFIDITERKKAEEMLLDVTAQKQASQYARTLIEVSIDPLVTISADGKITDVNEATVKATGVPRQELIGTEFSNYFTEPQKAKEGYQQVFAKGFVTDYPLTIRHHNGNLMDILYNASLYKDTHGNVLGVFAAARDVTALKRAEDELKRHRDNLETLVKERTKDLEESEERLSRSQEIAHLGSWELDLTNNRLTWSDEVYRIFGLKPKEFGATYEAFLEAVHPDDRAAVDAAYSSSLQEGRDTYEIEHRVVRKNTGEIRVVHEKGEHFRGESGKVIRSIGMVHDITERKRGEEARERLLSTVQKLSSEAQKRAEQLDAIFASTAEPMIVLDNDFNVLRINDAAKNFVGFDFEGMNLRDVASRVSLRGVDGKCFKPDELSSSRTLEGSVVRNAQYVFTDESTGEERAMASYAAPIKKGGEVTGAVVVWHDITEEKRLEDLRNSLLRDLSHQLKTPLSIIEMASGILSKDLKAAESAGGLESIDMISRNTLEMRKMVSSILKLSSLESGSVKTERMEFDIADAVRSVLQQLRPLAEKKKIELKLSAAPSKLKVNSDRERMSDVITNLVENAIKFTDKGSVNVSVEKDGEHVDITVEDTGIGLSSSQLKQLFMRFYKVDPSTKGTGLGLAICKETMRILSGEITVESKGLGKGSVFKITIPMDR